MAEIPRPEPQRGFSAREIAQRNRESCGKPLSTVMKTAATACELAHAPTSGDPKRRG